MAYSINSAALQLGRKETDSFTLKGGLYKFTTWANLQKEGCKMLGVTQLIVHSIINTDAHSGRNTAYSSQYYKHSNTQCQ